MIEWRVVDSIHSIDPQQWQSPHPLLSPAFLGSLEDALARSEDSGWQPQHLVGHLHQRPVFIYPSYLKTHSMGEFVFDHAFARAYAERGLPYYPKLVSMIPCTPLTVPRQWVAADVECAPLVTSVPQVLKALTQHKDTDSSVGHGATTRAPVSSVHALFLPESELSAYHAAGFAHRMDCQFHWHNQSYQDFDHYLNSFTADKRKKAKRERRRIAEMGITLHWRRADDLSDDDWAHIYTLKRLTFLRHGHEPYLPLEFFLLVRERAPDTLWVNLAYHRTDLVAAAIFFKSADTLYGRYWGAIDAIHSLHFEVCYHQGIEFCIQQGLQRFEPGTQGEHKITRGFTPTLTHSMHYFGEPLFQEAALDYFQRERAAVRAYQSEATHHLPFKFNADTTLGSPLTTPDAPAHDR